MRYIIGLLIVLTSCTSEPLNEKSFIWAEEINADKERIFETQQIGNKINLNDLEFGSVFDLRVTDDKILFEKSGGNEIVVFDKNNLTDYYILEFPEGRGPGEIIALSDYKVFEDQIFIADRNQSKILIYDLAGELVKEFIVTNVFLDQIAVLNESTILCYSMSMKEQIFTILNTDGEIVKSFIENEPDLNMMMYTGEIHSENNSVYFSGYSEPIIKKYSIEDEQLEFSVEVIDSYETHNNYVEYSNAQGFSEDAIYNTIGMDVFGDIIANVPRHNGRDGYKYIDFYNNENGEYLKTIEMIGYPLTYGVQIDSDYIYSLEMDTSRTRWLVMYKNGL